jgi:hypothetical protein
MENITKWIKRMGFDFSILNTELIISVIFMYVPSGYNLLKRHKIFCKNIILHKPFYSMLIKCQHLSSTFRIIKNMREKAWGYNIVGVVLLPSIYETLSSISITIKNRKKYVCICTYIYTHTYIWEDYQWMRARHTKN